MATAAITINLPEQVYEQIRTAAERAQRPVGEVVLEAVLAATPTLGEPETPLRSALAQLAYLHDAALWQMARATMPPAQRERLAWLHDKQQRDGLTEDEQAEEQVLLQLYRETLLVRAQAAVLLKQRGYDVTNPEQLAPLA